MAAKVLIAEASGILAGGCAACALQAVVAMEPTPASEQLEVARLVEIHGNVLVSDEEGIHSAGEGARLRARVRVLVTANSAATVQYVGGCRVLLRADDRLQIGPEEPCTAGQVDAEERR